MLTDWPPHTVASYTMENRKWVYLCIYNEYDDKVKIIDCHCVLFFT